jgi:hypothetical protein
MPVSFFQSRVNQPPSPHHRHCHCRPHHRRNDSHPSSQVVSLASYRLEGRRCPVSAHHSSLRLRTLLQKTTQRPRLVEFLHRSPPRSSCSQEKECTYLRTHLPSWVRAAGHLPHHRRIVVVALQHEGQNFLFRKRRQANVPGIHLTSPLPGLFHRK